MRNLLFYLLISGPCLAQPHPMHSSGTKSIYLSLMDTMMRKMDAVRLSGSPDRDFLQMMIPHHQGALDMALNEVKHGTRREMIQLAKSILAEQRVEIQQMTLLLPQLTVTERPDGDEPALNRAMTTMMNDMPSGELLASNDEAFAAVMIPHHQAGIDMARVVLQYGKDVRVKRLAESLLSNQQMEIVQMKTFLK